MTDKKNVTQNDVAKLAGVTRSMVSYVLNGSDRTVADETKQKILSAIETLGYRPNKFAQGLSSGNDVIAGNKIGVILCNADVFLRPYYTEIIAGIHSSAHENKYHVSFIRFFAELKNPILFNELIHQEEICGLILVSTDQCIISKEDKTIIDKIKDRIEKVVCVEWQGEGLSSVNFDRQNAAYKATKYLIEKKYNDIAYIGESDNRVLGFKQAIAEIKNENELYIDGASDMASGFKAAERLFSSVFENKEKKLPRAICAGSDEVAIGVLHYLNENKIAVPETIAIISIDNIEMAEYTNPPLTTVNVQKRAMGERAVEMIVNNNCGRKENAVSVMLPVNLIERKST